MPDKSKKQSGALRVFAKAGVDSVRRKWQQGDIARKSKEIFMVNTKDVTYEPLQGPTHIRLLKLEPGSPTSIVRCSLRHVDLKDQPKYAALSYTWKQDPSILGGGYSMGKNVIKTFLRGDDVKVDIPQDTGELEYSKGIYCDEKVTKIFPNLYNALVQLRRHRAGEYWIDALCINQSDDTERAKQVQFMGHIYQGASQVVVWLGASGRDVADSIAHLENLAANNIDAPPINFDDNDTEVAPQSNPKPDENAVDGVRAVATSVVMSQWFRRTWVVQELCWAKNVVFAMDNSEMSIKSIVKAFEMAQGYFASMNGAPSSNDEISHAITRFGRVLAPQIQHASAVMLKLSQAPMTLQARETFQRGGKWTLRQWLMACRGRSATDPRDLVFAGLSLIKPERLTIDRSIRTDESVSMQVGSSSLITRRRYYPETIPPIGMKNASRLFRTDSTSSSMGPSSLLPKGLWSVLLADYTVSASEVLVNTAACLLTHTGTEELLSIAARTSRPEAYTSAWWISPGDQLSVDDLPSWAPAPGTWTFRVNDIQAFCKVTQSRANVLANGKPIISKDGLTLFLDASRVDVIDHFILEGDLYGEMDVPGLRLLLNVILDIQNKYGGQRRSLLNTLTQVLFDLKEQRSPPSVQDQSRWFSQTLAYAVFSQVARLRLEHLHDLPRRFEHPKKTSDEFVDWLDERHKKASKNCKGLMKLFTDLRRAFPDQHWPDWADPVRFDIDVHKTYLRELAKRSTSASEKNDQGARDAGRSDTEGSRSGHSIRKAWKQGLSESNKSKVRDEKRAEQEKTILSALKAQDPEGHARLNAMAKSSLAWRKVFITRQGYVGLGPSWLNTSDTIMLIDGAHVPYVFTSLGVDLGRRERDIRGAMDKNQSKYNETVQSLHGKEKKNPYLHPLDNVIHNRRQGKLKRLDEEQVVLQRKLDRISNFPRHNNGWVLQGEVFIEDRLEERAVKNNKWERIAIL
ncbi:hypothetical protein EK21DRAFT_84468 [Setomelanomma holmii]|uniref:Heterokaryon incompatibility domain-containing protein n=1 Tax=Setomelanomma holmii TaxID=210430 RepID=A0A9P4HJZ2_9PLEO|nr:hypothetical protein EK21DRAFT_84468 [Setomelanomma holmii]